MTSLSSEQDAIVALPLEPVAVTACAGSGKTRTAVRRLAAVRRLHTDDRSLVALLSFSNVAVETFRNEYAAAIRAHSGSRRDRAVEIDTMDGFITTNVLRPHGHRVMGCGCTPFLVEGREPFLKSFTVYDGARSHPTASLGISLQGGAFVYTIGRQKQIVDRWRAEPAVAKLGALGAYTHASARYWVWRTLKDQPSLLAALARRYPHILVDEAQDIGPEHQEILEMLMQQGSQVSLIGDPHQAIFEFAKADGTFLSGYGARAGVHNHRLSVNYRSVPSILAVANRLTQRGDMASRQAQEGRHGAFYIPYDPKDRASALATFRSLMETAKIVPSSGVVLCRSSDLEGEWGGDRDGQGVGVIRCFANAAISRDQLGKLARAFSETCAGVIGLLAPEYGVLTSQLARGSDQTIIGIRRAIWAFVRDANTGLPSATLVADTAWHPLLCQRIRALLAVLEHDFEVKRGENLGNKLAKRELEHRPLIEMPDLAQVEIPSFPVSTVHKVKGASIDAVLYVAKKGHVQALLEGTRSEDGRIGYVALTRARDLFVLAVPSSCLAGFESDLQAKGFQRAG